MKCADIRWKILGGDGSGGGEGGSDLESGGSVRDGRGEDGGGNVERCCVVKAMKGERGGSSLSCRAASQVLSAEAGR